MSTDLFFCYSPALSQYIRNNGIECIGVGNNVNNGRTFWQFARGEELDAIITEWQRNKPSK